MTADPFAGRHPAQSSFDIPNDDLLARLSRAYRHACHAFGTNKGQVWGAIFAKQAALHDALLRNDLDRLRALFSNPAATHLYFGVDNLFPEPTAVLVASADARSGMAGTVFRDLTILSKELGVDTAGADTEQILAAIERQLGIKVTFPNPFPNEFGLPTSRGVASYRAIHSIYQAARLKTLATAADTHIVEIGGGMGRTCYFAQCLGLRRYTIVDLPMTLIGQALFLAAAIGAERLSLPGEQASGADITLISPDQFEAIGKFDVALNVDSLPEMSYRQFREYMVMMRNQCSVLLSINHELSLVHVRDFERAISRKPLALRDGYFEEVYTFEPGTASSQMTILAKMGIRRARSLAMRVYSRLAKH